MVEPYLYKWIDGHLVNYNKQLYVATTKKNLKTDPPRVGLLVKLANH